MKKKPNLFTYATKELSQDAVICWLIEWAVKDIDDELGVLGRKLVESLLSREGQEGKRILCGAVEKTEIYRQEKRIDVLARINGKHVLLIEDKTTSGPKENQLKRYRCAVLSGKTKLGTVSERDLFPIYFKTGNQSLAAEKIIESAGYKVFDRKSFLDVLRSYRGENPIMLDFLCNLESREADTQSFRNWSQTGERNNWLAWEGLYRELEQQFLKEHKGLWPVDDWDGLAWGWGYVPNPSGGFLGLYWRLEDWKEEPVYLQLEKEKLCFKVSAGKLSQEEQEKMKWKWHNRIIRQHERVKKPTVMRRGNTMTVAVHKDGWLRYNDKNVLDIDATIESLRQAEQVLTAAVKS